MLAVGRSALVLATRADHRHLPGVTLSVPCGQGLFCLWTSASQAFCLAAWVTWE